MALLNNAALVTGGLLINLGYTELYSVGFTEAQLT